MKVNADYRKFKTLDDIFNDMTLTISSWQDSKIEKVCNNPDTLGCYVNDWYYDYSLNAEEFETVVEMVSEYFYGWTEG